MHEVTINSGHTANQTSNIALNRDAVITLSHSHSILLARISSSRLPPDCTKLKGTALCPNAMALRQPNRGLLVVLSITCVM
jgi:hypothetical protein